MKQLKRLPYSFYQKCQEQISQDKSFYGAILMFHQVNDDSLGWDDVGCSISQDSFAKLIDSIHPVVPISQLLKRGNVGEVYYITFDDAYDDVYQVALPILEKADMPFTVFVAPGLLDKGKYLTQSHLMEMS